MALEDWTDDDGDSGESDEDSGEMEGLDTPDRDESESTKRAIAANIQRRAMTSQLDVEVDDGEVRGNIEDVVMMFALMTMDYQESDFQDLVTDDEE